MAITNNNTAIISKLTNIELSIQISLSGLSFCTLDRSTNTITDLKVISFKKKLNPLELLDKLKETFNTEPALQNNFNTVNVIHENNLSSLVPKSIFNEASISDYLKFSTKILKSDFITYDAIELNESVNVYVPYVNINNFIYEKFGTFTFNHFSTILIEQILHIEKDATIQKMYVNINADHFEIIIVNQTKLIFYNTFEYKTKQDFIYYLMFTIEQLNLNPEIINLIFIGNIDLKHELFTIAYKYIRFVYLGNREDNFKYKINAHPNSYHSNFTLIKSFECA